jgi:guanylate kinase
LAGELKKVVLYDSRAPRPGEVDGVDYHFRTREYIEQLRNKNNFLVTDVRGDLQALDMDYLRETIAERSRATRLSVWSLWGWRGGRRLPA